VTHILNDVLSLQKIEDGALTLDCAPFDVDRMVRSTLYSFKAPCRERKLRLKVNLDDLNAMAAAAARDASASWFWPPHLSPLCFGVLGDVHRLRQVRRAERDSFLRTHGFG
jgi:signal transduction histidine kinase